MVDHRTRLARAAVNAWHEAHPTIESRDADLDTNERTVPLQEYIDAPVHKRRYLDVKGLDSRDGVFVRWMDKPLIEFTDARVEELLSAAGADEDTLSSYLEERDGQIKQLQATLDEADEVDVRAVQKGMAAIYQMVDNDVEDAERRKELGETAPEVPVDTEVPGWTFGGKAVDALKWVLSKAWGALKWVGVIIKSMVQSPHAWNIAFAILGVVRKRFYEWLWVKVGWAKAMPVYGAVYAWNVITDAVSTGYDRMYGGSGVGGNIHIAGRLAGLLDHAVGAMGLKGYADTTVAAIAKAIGGAAAWLPVLGAGATAINDLGLAIGGVVFSYITAAGKEAASQYFAYRMLIRNVAAIPADLKAFFKPYDPLVVAGSPYQVAEWEAYRRGGNQGVRMLMFFVGLFRKGQGLSFVADGRRDRTMPDAAQTHVFIGDVEDEVLGVPYRTAARIRVPVADPALRKKLLEANGHADDGKTAVYFHLSTLAWDLYNEHMGPGIASKIIMLGANTLSAKEVAARLGWWRDDGTRWGRVDHSGGGWAAFHNDALRAPVFEPVDQALFATPAGPMTQAEHKEEGVLARTGAWDESAPRHRPVHDRPYEEENAWAY